MKAPIRNQTVYIARNISATGVKKCRPWPDAASETRGWSGSTLFAYVRRSIFAWRWPYSDFTSEVLWLSLPWRYESLKSLHYIQLSMVLYTRFVRIVKYTDLNPFCAENKHYALFANRLDPGQVLGDAAAGPRSNQFATQFTIPH